MFARFREDIIQDEIFRLASLGIAGVDLELEEEHRLSDDISRFLKSSDKTWDSFFYRRSRDLLVRYNLAQSVKEEWPEVTMHKLVKWRVIQYRKEQEWNWWHLVFVLAACHYLTQKHESPEFRRHLLVHISELTEALLSRKSLDEKTRLFMKRSLKRVHYIRQQELFQIHRTLTDDHERGIAVLSGLGGAGKTRLASTYAENHSAGYSDIFWLHVGTEDLAKRSYIEIAKQIIQKHPSASLPRAIIADSQTNEVNEVVAAVKR